MHRKFIALVSGLAVAVALTAASTAPARADNDAAKVLAGIAALAIIGAAIDNNNRSTVVERQVIVPPRPAYGYARPVYAPPRTVYVQPQRNVYVQRNVVRHVDKNVYRQVNRHVNKRVDARVDKHVKVYRQQPGRPFHENRR
ncbi:hypothetical protein [Pseudodonghicola xiamenensis]|uniref:PXPV repeat-containing protein n=1 Tax=Pseudodonghicola xiamenensis TaxID=337702 RepID=A0A8J3H699_9RHOB|nr:hypothetical protein [Pseudodonghicola xiamenensis]GHG83794.1 hypothetical protein GCM10010961_09500 [Pseudodonghicola xiamenensis]